jgi:hypothetical protein
VGAFLAGAEVDGQERLGAVQGLDVSFLIEAEPKRTLCYGSPANSKLRCWNSFTEPFPCTASEAAAQPAPAQGCGR